MTEQDRKEFEAYQASPEGTVAVLTHDLARIVRTLTEMDDDHDPLTVNIISEDDLAMIAYCSVRLLDMRLRPRRRIAA